MTDKELIQALVRDYEWGKEHECDVPYLAEVADRLEALIAENEHLRETTKMMPQWVSVKERLPEPLVRVVGIVKDNPFSQYVPEVVHLDRHGWVFSYARRYVTNVTHWMPLPSTEGVE